MTDAEKIADLERQIAAMKSPSIGEWLKRAMSWITNNKATIVIVLMLLRDAYREVWPVTDHAAVQQVAQQAAHEEVKAKLPAAVDKAVDARPVPPPVIQQVPISPGTVKTNKE